MDHLLYGCAYYDEYMPYERLDKDLAMMKKAGINVIRIAESTWSTEEPEDGVFDFLMSQRCWMLVNVKKFMLLSEHQHMQYQLGWQKSIRISW